MKYVVALTALLLLAGTAFAQTNGSANAPRTNIKFDEGDVINGTTDKPDADVIEVVRGARFQTLIRTRDNFRSQVVSSVAKL